MKQKIIARGWETYKAHVLTPENAHPIQISECQMAFYAGALVALRGTFCITDSSISDEEGVAKMTELMAEPEEFLRLLKSCSPGTMS